MYDNTIKRSRSSSNSTDLDLLAGIPTTIGELEGEDGIYVKSKDSQNCQARYAQDIQTDISVVA